MLVLPAVPAVKVQEYVPGVEVALTGPKLPSLVPPERVRLNALLASPDTAFPAASSTTMVTASVSPVATVVEAKLAVEFEALTAPGVTVACGCDLS